MPASTHRRPLLLPAMVLLAAGVVLAWLLWPAPLAGWATAHGAATAAPGQPWRVTVTLHTALTGNWLCLDLHGADGGGALLGPLGSAEPQRVDDGGGSFEFAVPWRAAPTAAELRAVVWLSPTARWPEHVQAAISEPIAVQPGPPAVRAIALAPVMQQAAKEDAASLRVRLLVTGTWLAAALLLVWRRRQEGLLTLLLVGVCVGVAAFECSGAGPRLLHRLRAMVQQYHIYEARRGPQLIATIAVLLVCAGAAAAALRARTRHGLAVLGICLYAAVAGAGLLSLHEVDRALVARLLGLPVGKMLRLGGGLLALADGVRRPAGRR